MIALYLNLIIFCPAKILIIWQFEYPGEQLEEQIAEKNYEVPKFHGDCTNPSSFTLSETTITSPLELHPQVQHVQRFPY